MAKGFKLSGVWFCGNEASDYAKEQGYLDYATLAKAFDAVLNNNIINIEVDYWEQENGIIDNTEKIDELTEELDSLEQGKRYTGDHIYFVDEYGDEITGDDAEKIDNRIAEIREEIEELEEEQENGEVFQWYIISDAGAEILKDYTNEIVFYNEKLDVYLWGVTHYGTAWSYVLTDIPLNAKEQ